MEEWVGSTVDDRWYDAAKSCHHWFRPHPFAIVAQEFGALLLRHVTSFGSKTHLNMMENLKRNFDWEGLGTVMLSSIQRRHISHSLNFLHRRRVQLFLHNAFRIAPPLRGSQESFFREFLVRGDREVLHKQKDTIKNDIVLIKALGINYGNHCSWQWCDNRYRAYTASYCWYSRCKQTRL